jgi:putative oxidoreductase
VLKHARPSRTRALARTEGLATAAFAAVDFGHIAIAEVLEEIHYSRRERPSASPGPWKEGAMSDVVSLISRVLLSAVFIVYGWFKLVDVASITNNPGTKRFMDLIAAGTPTPTWLGYLIAVIEFFGGIALLLGIKTRWLAWLFVAWLIVVTWFGHPFWGMEGQPRGANMANFYKNLAIMGGYLLLAVTGGGRYSVDSYMESKADGLGVRHA